MSNCKKLPYFEGLTDETIKQGSDFDPTEGVKAYDGYDEEIEYTYSPQELDTCLVGSQVIQYRASQTSEGDMLPNICIPDGLALALPSICDDYESTTAERIIRIIKANDPTIYGIPQVTVARDAAFNVLDGVTAVDDNGNPIADITYSGTLDKRVSGDIISIDDGDERYPVKSLKVTLEPIQDLNGYDKPWAGGAGRNLLNVGGRVNQTSAEVRYTSDDNYIILNGTKNGGGYATMGNLTLTLPAGTYYAKAFVISGTSTGTIDVYVNNGTADITGSLIGSSERTITLESETTLRFRFAVWNDGTVLTNYTVGIVVSKTSGIDKFYPYSNIAPISGWTDVDTHRTGKNIWGGTQLRDDILSKVPNAVADDTNKTIRYDASSVSGKNLFNKFKPNTQYTIILRGYNTNTSSQSENNSIRYTDGTTQYLQGFVNGVSRTVTYASKSIECIRGQWVTSTTYLYYDECGIFEGVLTADQFEPYEAETYTTALGRTVYGADVEQVSGVMTDKYGMVDLSTLSWSGSSGIKLSTDIANVVKAPSANNIPANIVAEKYATSAVAPISANDGKIGIETTGRIQCGSSETPSGMLCYELATPQTYQLDPQTISLLHGNNNVWSDGEATMVYSVELPTDGEVSYPLEGEYEITYSATDKCGNVGEAIRHITVQ